MRFATVDNCLKFFNMAMIDHSCDCVEEYWLTQHGVLIGETDDYHPRPALVMCGNWGDIFIFGLAKDSTSTITPWTMLIDGGMEDNAGVEPLSDKVRDLLSRSATKGWLPKELLVAIGKFRTGHWDEGSTFDDLFHEEIEHLEQMLELLV